jgi:glucokinase
MAMLAEGLEQGRATCLKAGDDPQAMALAAGQGDPLARDLWAQAGQALGRAVAALVAVTGLDLVVVGGGMAPAWPLMEQAARQELAACLKMVDPGAVTLTASGLGQAAPLLGAAALASQMQNP